MLYVWVYYFGKNLQQSDHPRTHTDADNFVSRKMYRIRAIATLHVVFSKCVHVHVAYSNFFEHRCKLRKYTTVPINDAADMFTWKNFPLFKCLQRLCNLRKFSDEILAFGSGRYVSKRGVNSYVNSYLVIFLCLFPSFSLQRVSLQSNNRKFSVLSG